MFENSNICYESVVTIDANFGIKMKPELLVRRIPLVLTETNLRDVLAILHRSTSRIHLNHFERSEKGPTETDGQMNARKIPIQASNVYHFCLTNYILTLMQEEETSNISFNR